MSQRSITMVYKGVTLEIEYNYTPGDPGKMHLANGDPGWPPEPAEVEITKLDLVYEGEGCVLMVDLVDINDDKYESIQDQILEEVSNEQPDERN